MSKRREKMITAKSIKKRLMKEMNVDKIELMSIINEEIKELEGEISENIHIYELLTSFLEYLMEEN